MSSELAPPHMSGIAHMGPAGVLGGMMAAGMVIRNFIRIPHLTIFPLLN